MTLRDVTEGNGTSGGALAADRAMRGETVYMPEITVQACDLAELAGMGRTPLCFAVFCTFRMQGHLR